MEQRVITKKFLADELPFDAVCTETDGKVVAVRVVYTGSKITTGIDVDAMYNPESGAFPYYQSKNAPAGLQDAISAKMSAMLAGGLDAWVDEVLEVEQ